MPPGPTLISTTAIAPIQHPLPPPPQQQQQQPQQKNSPAQGRKIKIDINLKFIELNVNPNY